LSLAAAPIAMPSGEAGVELEIQGRVPGRMVLAEPDGTLYLGRNYDIHRSDDGGRSFHRVASMPSDLVRRLAGGSRLLSRLARLEVRALVRTAEGGLVASNRQGVFVARPGEQELRASRVENGAVPLYPPMRICRGPGGEILWGEYGSPKVRRPMRLFASRDSGESFELVHTLDKVLHVHNVVWDPGQGHYWVLTGDHDPEPGIGRLSADLAHFDWLVKGEQRYRAVEVFDFGDRLVYATDSHLEQNALVSLDKASGRIERLREFDGSCIYACRFGGLYALTTSVEPSPVNRSPFAELWLSRDAETWRCAWRARKDRWNAIWLQFGSLVLPSGATDRELVAFSGQAVEGLDGATLLARVSPGAGL
jgi:hypothetical protein